MSLVLHAAEAMALFSACGALPVWQIAGRRPVAIFLVPLFGMLLAGIAGGLTVVVAGGVLRWFVALAVAANAAALASWHARREEGDSGRPRATHPLAQPPGFGGAGGVLGVVVLLGAVAFGLRALARPRIGFDARSIWLVHARWILEGHRIARAALSNPALPFAHSSYPPLSGGMVALAWTVTASRSLRLGVVLIALATACAVGAAGSALLEAALGASRRLRSSGSGRASSVVVGVVGILASGGLCLGAYGIAGASATNGYVDLLWSACATAGAGFGLLLPLGGSNGRVAALLIAFGVLTKNEGIAAGAILVVLMYLRGLRDQTRTGEGAASEHPLRRGALHAVGLAAIVAWPAIMLGLHALLDPDLSGPRHGSMPSRLDATLRSFGDHLHLAGAALVVAALGGVVLRHAWKDSGFGDDRLVWLIGLGELAATALFYTVGTTEIQFWLATSVDRTTIFANLLGLSLLGFWMVVSVGGTFLGTGAQPRHRIEGAEADRLAGGTPDVLHQQP